MSERNNGAEIFKYVVILIAIIAVVGSFWLYVLNYGKKQVTVIHTHQALQDAGFVPSDPDKKPHWPGDKPLPDGVTPVVSGEGHVWVGPDEVWPDTLEVGTSVVEGPTGIPWLATFVQGKPVKWDEFPAIEWPVRAPGNSPWRGRLEFALTEDSTGQEDLDVGIGAAWTPVSLWGVRIGIAGTVDASLFNDLQPEWAAVSGTLEGDIIGPLTGGVDLGAQFGNRDVVFHRAAFLGLKVDF